MSDDTSGEPAPQRRVVRRVVRKPVVAPPPVAREEPPAPAPTPPTRDDRRAASPGRRAARAPRLSLPTLSLPKVSLPSSRHRDDATDDTTGTTVTETPAPEPVTWDDRRADDAAPSRPTVALTRVRERSDRLRGTVAHGLERASTLPLPALAAAVGLVLGLVAVLLCWVATRVFASLLGTPAGGRWGFGVLVVVAVAAVVAGSRVLRAVGAPEPGATSLVAVLLVPVAVLGLFLGPSDSGWAFLIVPALAAVSFAVVQPVTARLATAEDTDD